MYKYIDITGQKFNRLTAIKFEYRDKIRKSTYWSFQCDCGVIKNIRACSVKDGSTKSCGCLTSVSEKKTNYKHGHSKSMTYRSWNSMRWRCGRLKNYETISYCKEWGSYETFLLDMGERPEGMSLDRIDGSKSYEKNNCRWANKSQQAMNTRKQVNRKTSSKYKGVIFLKERQTWRVGITIDGKHLFLGMFKTEAAAALAYNEAAKKYHGEFACLNHI